MKYYPVCLDVKEKACLVVGGGNVGLRKVSTLIDCGARVNVVSPVFSDGFKKLSSEALFLIPKPYHDSMLTGMFLVIGATDNHRLNRQIKEDANRQNILCNIVDFPEGSNFVLPAVVNRGDLLIAVSTSGTSPAYAKMVKQDLEKQFGRGHGDFLFLMGAIRKKLLDEGRDPGEHKLIFERLIRKQLLTLVSDGDHNTIDTLLLEILGKGYSFKDLVSGDMP